MARGMGRTGVILRWIRQRILNIEKRDKIRLNGITWLGHMTGHIIESSGRIGSYLSIYIDK